LSGVKVDTCLRATSMHAPPNTGSTWRPMRSMAAMRASNPTRLSGGLKPK
jgi:hypothetical protein